jgi:hypothetical protein
MVFHPESLYFRGNAAQRVLTMNHRRKNVCVLNGGKEVSDRKYLSLAGSTLNPIVYPIVRERGS